MSTVKALRTEKGWSQTELANHAGVSLQTIYRIEAGKATTKTVRNAVCQALGTQDVEIVVLNRVKSANEKKKQ